MLSLESMTRSLSWKIFLNCVPFIKIRISINKLILSTLFVGVTFLLNPIFPITILTLIFQSFVISSHITSESKIASKSISVSNSTSMTSKWSLWVAWIRIIIWTKVLISSITFVKISGFINLAVKESRN